jgi:hypothetical protein
MNTLIVAAVLALPTGADPFAGLDAGLVREIAGWKKGTPPPARLLRFPHGRIDAPVCGMRAWGDAVGDYISRITDVELLKALVFDPRADADCFRAAVRRLLSLTGVRDVRAMLAERRKTDPTDFSRAELATLTQLLASPYARVKVALLQRKDAEKEVAERVLRDMKAELATGGSWDRAYRKAADLLPDTRRAQEEKGWRTHLCYLYDGLISPTGFDLLDRRISDQLNHDHIRQVFETKGGVHLWETKDCYWLYYVEKIDE